jgi:ATP-dependent helicase/nuclease subunit B
MVETVRPSLFTIPFGEDLCAATVSAVLKKVGDDPLSLIETLIILPNNRAIKSMTEAFVRRASPGLLLPRMVAVGDLALDEALGSIIDPLGASEDISPVIAPMQRLLLLSGLVRKYRSVDGKSVQATEALRLAGYLGDVIDELEIEQIRFSRFDVIKPEDDLAGHWQNSYAQLLAMIPDYDKQLQVLQLLGPAARRNLLLARLAQSFRQNPPRHMVVAAGISTAAPAIATLLRQIALLPQSMVILPTIDLKMSDENWESLGPHSDKDGTIARKSSHEVHPQYHLKLLLDRMGFQKSEVDLLSKSIPEISNTITEIFCLPSSTEYWRDLPDASKKLPHVRMLTADDSAEEARAISILVRSALETPEQRIAVITPDRELAVRVAAHLKRWNIHVDDSAGTPLMQTPHGTLFMALVQALQDKFAPVSILAIAKHPLVKFGDERKAWIKQVRKLDLILRGPSAGVGLSAITKSIADYKTTQQYSILEIDDEFNEWWAEFNMYLATLDKVVSNGLADINAALQSVATILTDGNIWKGATGRQLANVLGELARYDLTALGDSKRDALVSIFTELLGREAVRPAYGGHPRVAIYGLLEARLQQADLVICGGLNEGTWPQLPKLDPWLAPRVRRELGLAGLERNIGLAAHDLASALGSKQVVLTRAKRNRSGPTVASRFLLRIQALLGEAFVQDNDTVQLSRDLEKPTAAIKYPKPAPTPTLEQRNVDLSVTDFDRLKADPYAFYANKILRLKLLEVVDAQPGPAWRGTVVHDILEAWAKEDDCDPEKLMQRAEGLLNNPAVHPQLRALWQPRIAEGLRWVADYTKQLKDNGRTVLVAEKSGHTFIGGVKVKGRADRIDIMPDGGLVIIDYKTGKAPSAPKVAAGYSLQLGLIGLIAQEGGIKEVTGTVQAFEYWSLSKGKDNFGFVSRPVTDKSKDGVIQSGAFVEFAHDEALNSISDMITGNHAFTAKLHPEYAPFADYDQLMRFEEWNGREPIDDGAQE